MNYANQQVLYVQSLGALEHRKDEVRSDGTKKDFLVALNWDEQMDIMYVLNGNEYKVWTYFLKWRGSKRGYAISPADIEDKLKISESTFRRIKKRFIELGMLVKISSNTYNFFPYSAEIKKIANEQYGEDHRNNK